MIPDENGRVFEAEKTCGTLPECYSCDQKNVSWTIQAKFGWIVLTAWS